MEVGSTNPTLSYVRTVGGALASMHDVVPEDEAGHRVVFFNPASNRGQVSRLRLINPGEEAVAVRITGVDSAGGRARWSSPSRPGRRGA